MSESYDSRHDDLPPELRAALDEFDAWSRERLLIEQEESTPSEPLYHYTDETALTGILTKKEVWCFRHLHQRDRTEFEYSLEVAREVIRSVGWTDDFVKRRFCGFLQDMLSVGSPADWFEFYLFSLSRHRDDRQQWIEYGRDGRGFAIGFGSSLLQPEKDTLSAKATENVHVGRVIYGYNATAARHRLVIERAADIFSNHARANEDLFRKIGPSRLVVPLVQELLASQLVWNCLTAKSQEFENEREVRCVILNVPRNFDPLRKSMASKDYVEVPFPLKDPGGVAEILVGPRAPPDAEARVVSLLKNLGFPSGIPVIRSKAVM